MGCNISSENMMGRHLFSEKIKRCSEGWYAFSDFILSDLLPSENIQFMNEITSLQKIRRDCMKLEPKVELHLRLVAFITIRAMNPLKIVSQITSIDY